MTDVVIVGGGPVGLLLASELKLAGADPLVLESAIGEQRRTRDLGLRGINARSMHTLGLRGLTGPLVEAQWAMFRGLAAQRTPKDEEDVIGFMMSLFEKGESGGHFAGLPLFGEVTRTPERVLIKQHLLEGVLADRAESVGVRIRSGCQVTDVADEGPYAVVTLAGGETLRAGYVVGCDGGRSTVRKRAGFPFEGTPATMTGRTAVAELATPIASAMRGPGGLLNLSLVPGEIATIEFDGGPDGRDAPVTAEELQGSIRRVSGNDAVVTRVEAGIRYSDNTRHADTYRRGRILLAGDAAHVHSPIGGQGLNLGLQDAANLGWKLGLVVRGLAGEDLLDTYTAERHPVAATVLRNTRAQVALMRPGPQVDALREVLGETLRIPGAQRHFLDMVNGTDIDYAPGSAHPLVGRFLPDLEIKDAGYARDLQAGGHGLLLDLADSAEVRRAASGHGDRVRVITGAAPDGSVEGLAALLVRPDGYVAWVGADGLADALTTWFGHAT
ncbi:FAD-dependent monooxygenase [Nonomuraea sp. NPDC049152]|uniref:FAD-dependent monooxygenase n=1 Tax=Nonomuraea sp. NPDC049152 TaxID=3154350 RepID=UPI0033D411F6